MKTAVETSQNTLIARHMNITEEEVRQHLAESNITYDQAIKIVSQLKKKG